ncbi:hypothetical protein IFM89_025596 [Coptis chinensis]|uniref:Uncharacterized protein n=1 Tax=Coptis chinensis TaxID=261450 RepID=A0A835ID62_9MAGN|nr:hypothetical protein IFM89_025596 [Coptis chinensis]
MATRTMKNGLFVSEEVREKMVFGKDRSGRVLGLGSGVSKTTLMAGSPYKRKVEEVEKSKLELQSQMDDLKHEAMKIRKSMTLLVLNKDIQLHGIHIVFAVYIGMKLMMGKMKCVKG